MKTWMLAARPKTLGAAIAPVVMGSAMAVEAGGFHLGSAVCCLLGALLIQIGTNFANDYFDHAKGADTSQRIGPTRATQGGPRFPGRNDAGHRAGFRARMRAGTLYRHARRLARSSRSALCRFCAACSTPAAPSRWLATSAWPTSSCSVFFGPVAVCGTYYVQTAPDRYRLPAGRRGGGLVFRRDSHGQQPARH